MPLKLGSNCFESLSKAMMYLKGYTVLVFDFVTGICHFSIRFAEDYLRENIALIRNDLRLSNSPA